MPFPFDHVAVHMNFGGELKQKLIDSGATELWPLANLQGNVSGIIAGLVHDELDSLNRNSPGMLPEYGLSMGFNGTDSFVSFAHSAVLNGTTSWAVMLPIKLDAGNTLSSTQTILTKNFGSGTAQVEVRLTTASGGSISANAYIGGVQRTITYTIPSLADWRNRARLIIVRYTGADFQLIEVQDDATVTTRATTAVTGTFGTGTSELVFGATASVGPTQFYFGALQYVTWWTNDYPSDAEITSFAASFAWVNVTGDVHRSGVEFEGGIRGDGPLARIADTGTLQFSLRNHQLNSGGVVGYYSPDHASVRSGFGYGNPVRLQCTDPNTAVVYTRFVGRVVDIQVRPGLYGSRLTDIVAADYMDELSRARTPTLASVANEPTYTLLGRLIDALPVKPHHSVASSSGIELFNYGLDFESPDGHPPKAKDTIAAVNQSELGWVYIRGNTVGGGQLTFDSRIDRAEDTTPDWTLTTQHQMEPHRSREVLTRVDVTIHQREPSGSAVTLFTLTAPLLFNYGTSRTLECEYTDPTNPDKKIGATDVSDPVFVANSAADGSGSNQTAFLTIRTLNKGSERTTVELTYSGAYSIADIWLTSLTIQGDPVRRDEPVTISSIAEDADRRHYGATALAVDMKYQTDLTRGAVAADYLRAAYGTERTVVRSLMIRVGQGSSAGLIAIALRADVGDLVTVTESVTGLTSTQHFVRGVRMRVADGVVETELMLSRRELPAWVFNVAGFSEFNTTTRVA